MWTVPFLPSGRCKSTIQKQKNPPQRICITFQVLLIRKEPKKIRKWLIDCFYAVWNSRCKQNNSIPIKEFSVFIRNDSNVPRHFMMLLTFFLLPKRSNSRQIKHSQLFGNCIEICVNKLNFPFDTCSCSTRFFFTSAIFTFSHLLLTFYNSLRPFFDVEKYFSSRMKKNFPF